VKSWIRIRVKVKIQKLTMEVLETQIEPWRVHHFDEEQDPFRMRLKSWIRIGIKVKIQKLTVEALETQNRALEGL
jgi:hypothetical protein